MKVAILSHTYIEPENRGKIRALHAQGAKVTLFIPNEWNEPALKRKWSAPESNEDFEVIPLPVKRVATSPAAATWDLTELNTALDTSEFDLLHMEEEPWSMVCGSLGDATRKRNLPSTLFTWQNLPKHPALPLRWVARRRLKRLDGWVAGNQAAADLLRDVHPNIPLVVLPQIGIQAVNPRPRERDGHQVLSFVGRLVVDKGIYDLVAALASSSDTNRLEVVGDGPEMDGLKADVSSKGLEAQVSFRGALPHAKVDNIWGDIDTLVLPSLTTRLWAEQFGHVLIEAMAAGKAIIGSDSGAIPEVIGSAGKVFPEGDSSALAKCIDELTNDTEFVRFSELAVERAHEFTNDRIAAKLLAFWEDEVLTGKSNS